MSNNISPWLKVVALFTAVGLSGAYVWRQQQKAALLGNDKAERSVLPSSKSKVVPLTEVMELTQENPVKNDRELMPSSKSGAVFIPEQKWDKERTMMPGSKSGTIQIGPKIDLELPSPEPVAPKERTLLPGSKSIPMPIFRKQRLAPADQPKPDEP